MKNKETKFYRKEDIKKSWYIIDASEYTLGRLASKAAMILMGKNKPEYTPNSDCGDYIIVINSDKVKISGRKLENKKYYRHTGWPGGLVETPLSELMKKKSDFVIRESVRRMLPKNKLASQLIKKLKIYKDAEYKEQAQQPIKL